MSEIIKKLKNRQFFDGFNLCSPSINKKSSDYEYTSYDDKLPPKPTSFDRVRESIELDGPIRGKLRPQRAKADLRLQAHIKKQFAMTDLRFFDRQREQEYEQAISEYFAACNGERSQLESTRIKPASMRDAKLRRSMPIQSTTRPVDLFSRNTTGLSPICESPPLSPNDSCSSESSVSFDISHIEPPEGFMDEPVRTEVNTPRHLDRKPMFFVVTVDQLAQSDSDLSVSAWTRVRLLHLDGDRALVSLQPDGRGPTGYISAHAISKVTDFLLDM